MAEKSKAKKLEIVDELDNQLPAVLDESPQSLESKLSSIEKQLAEISSKQSGAVSAEFNALMDGYVNKANESQSFKVKFEHLQQVHDDLVLEFKATKEVNKKLKADIEAAQEALRHSESDLQRYKRDQEAYKFQVEEKISNLTDDRENLKIKLKQTNEQKDSIALEANNLRAELAEYKYKLQQLEQEQLVEQESSKRSQRDAQKNINELNEKLELRTREVEYKDALLNQLIKQISNEDVQVATLNSQPINESIAKVDSAVSIDLGEGQTQTTRWGAFGQ